MKKAMLVVALGACGGAKPAAEPATNTPVDATPIPALAAVDKAIGHPFDGVYFGPHGLYIDRHRVTDLDQIGPNVAAALGALCTAGFQKIALLSHDQLSAAPAF